MKKDYKILILIISVVFVFTSCSENYESLPINSRNVEEINCLKASLTDFANDYEGVALTRTSVSIDEGNNYQLVWSDTDTIGIFPNQGFQVAFPMSEGAGGKSARFNGGGWGLMSNSTYSAYCPLIGQFYLDKTKVPVNLAGQVQKANNSTSHISSYDYMCAINSTVDESGSVNFDFNHLVFILHLRLTLPKAGVYTSLVLETDGLLTTEGTLNLSNGELTSKKSSETFTLRLDNIELTSDNLVLDAYISLLPVDLTDKSFKVKVFDNEYNCYEANLKSRNYEAGTFYHQARVTGESTCSALPILMINTPNWKDVVDKDEWISNTSIYLLNTDGSVLDASGKIKGRGNATWGLPKKPYAIKFSDKQSPFGFPENKSWVLLAEYNDRSLLRTAYMCAVSRTTELEYTINYKHVNLFLNGEYKGIYLLTDKIEKSDNRIQIKKDGFIIEDDNYYNKEPLYFLTDLLNRGFTFKYPDADDGDILQDDANYNFIKDYMNNVENALVTLKTDPTNTEYLNYLDLESFAKYYVAAMVTEIEDPNHYYVMSSKSSKLKRMPMWDAEWSLGIWPVSAWGEVESILTRDTWNYKTYFNYLKYSPTFKEKVKEVWSIVKNKKNAITEEINSVSTAIALAQQYNFAKWPDSGRVHTMNVSFDTWEQEVNYVNQFFDNRFDWFDNYLTSW